MQTGSDVALEFLERYGDPPWALSAFSPDRKGADGGIFDEADAREFVERHDGKWNLYFHVNDPSPDGFKIKANKDQIARARWLHLDIDPRLGEDLAEERERIQKLIDDWVDDTPRPTIVIFSGGGFQLFWRLREPVEFSSDAEREEFERRNRWLEARFAGDNCHNVDRVMRLPGTLNMPTEKKIKQGRQIARAELVSFDEERVYDLDEFQLAEPKGAREAAPSRHFDKGARLESIDELDRWGVPDLIKVIVVNGYDPDDADRFSSRSEWQWWAVCEMTRCEVPPDRILAILLDESLGVSASVLDKKDPERYARRQVEKAQEFAEDPWLAKLNERYALIKNWGGKCLVLEEVYDFALRRYAITSQSVQHFKTAYCNKSIVVGTDRRGNNQTMPVGEWWVKNPKRREFDSVAFAPGQETPGIYNLWRGFAVEPGPGDCSLFLAHVRDNVCAGDEEHYHYLLGWLARAVQQPDTQGHSAVVLRGGQGTGKSFFARQFGSLFGRHFLAVTQPSHLVGNFNAHLQDVVVLFGDEAFYAGDKRHESVLKALVTEDTLTIERKGQDPVTSPNFIHLIMASNEDWVVPASADDRRFFVLDVSDARAKDTEYFGAIAAQLDDGGHAGLLRYLLDYDLSGFNVRDVPHTSALADQKIRSLEPIEQWWYRRLQEGRVVPRRKWTEPIPRDEMRDSYINEARDWHVTRRGNETVFGQFVQQMAAPRTVRKQVKVSTPDGFEVERRERCYLLPSLEECRRRWEEQYGETTWEEPDDDPESEEIPF